jgi:hypothetical protein
MSEEKIEALAKFLEVEVEDIEESGYDDSTFYVNSRTIRSGESPESLVKRATRLKNALK